MKIDLTETKKLVEQYRERKGALIPLLQEIQSLYGYVPEETVELVAQELNIYPVDIYGILTFYTQFYLTPRGKHTVRVCLGTACHVMGGKDVLDYMSKKLNVREGETTPDGMFTLERAACLGCCGMAPVVLVDSDFYGRCTVQETDKLVNNYTLEKAE